MTKKTVPQFRITRVRKILEDVYIYAHSPESALECAQELEDRDWAQLSCTEEYNSVATGLLGDGSDD